MRILMATKGFDGLLLHTFVAAVMSKTFKQQQGVHSQIPNKLDSGPTPLTLFFVSKQKTHSVEDQTNSWSLSC